MFLVIYILLEFLSDINEFFQDVLYSGLNFDKYDDIFVKVIGKGFVLFILFFEEVGILE